MTQDVYYQALHHITQNICMVPLYQQHIAKPVKANTSIGWQNWAGIELGVELGNFAPILILREVNAMGVVAAQSGFKPAQWTNVPLEGRIPPTLLHAICFQPL